MRRIVLCDIDHVLSAAWHRDHMIGVESWDAYHSASVADEPIHDVMSLVNTLHNDGWTIIALTARPEKWRNITMAWLVRHGIKVDEILMRPDESFHPAPEMKLQLAAERFSDITNQVAFLIEDRDDVCEAFHALGITTLQVKGRQS